MSNSSQNCVSVLTVKVYDGMFKNVTRQDLPSLLNSEEAEVATKATVYALMWLLSFLGNSCVILIVAMNSNMRTKTNIYITNLAISDMTIVLCPMWVTPFRHLTSNWILGETVCKLWPSLTVMSMTASVLTMTAIACDRFFAVVFPLRSRTSSRNVYAIIAVIWIFAIILGAPLYLASNLIHRSFNDYDEFVCQQLWAYYSCDYHRRQIYIRIYWTIVCGVANWLPLMAMMIGYFCIAVIMWRRDRIVPNNGRASVQHRSLKKVLRMLFVVLVSFIICWVPDQFTKLYTVYKGHTYNMPGWYNDVKFVTILLTHLNSLCNPLIYGAMNETFRKGFAYVFCCWKRKYYYERYRRSMTSLMQMNYSASVSQNSSHRVRIPMENNSLIR